MSVSQSVRQIVKNILSWICTCHPFRESRNQEANSQHFACVVLLRW